MLMKNNSNIILYLILFFLSLTLSLSADELDISASNIKLFQDDEKICSRRKCSYYKSEWNYY